MTRSRKLPTLRPLLIATFVSVMLTPFAAAADASFPLLGEWYWWSIGGVMIIIALAFAIGFVLPPVRKALNFGPFKGANALVVAGALLLAAAAVNGGFLTTGTPTASVAGGSSSAAAAAIGTAYDPAMHHTTSDVTFSAVDREDKTTISPTVKVYEAGTVTEKQAFEGTATPLYSQAMSSGSVTISGVQVQTIGCSVDIALDLAGYDEKLIPNVYICASLSQPLSNDVSVPTFEMDDIGTLSLSLSDSTLTCAAGSQCSYQVRVRNSEDDSWVYGVAVKWTEGDTAEDHTLDAVDSGACEIVDVSGTKYLSFTNALGPMAVETCTVEITRATGDTDGSFNLTADDLFTYYGATAFNANSNIRSATATAATEVTFA